ncbi:hypothetical protein BBF96_10990 [Anoxybacter fermentans]|uniref:Flagellar motor switch phosphatase FliY n=1 Tax=Anoxybacter fermentans TaxID=1323375 RepID=A0A3Q9HT50_9FIRM|nr:flagellar motor switch phosphatase FliY [Anoxybacter fermentans]AZR73867.1 hypothetical protein BBF96_10990 [Anoxybacter fermentans]
MTGRDILSQEEVDALLRYTEEEENDSGLKLTDEDKDVIGEIGNISMGTAATALSTILNRKVEITTPRVSLTTFNELVKEFDRPCVLVEVEYVAGLEGRNVLIVKQKDAAIIADLMMGGDGSNPPEELNDLYISAVGEAMNQMMGSASTSLANIINRPVNISPPITEFLTLNSDAIQQRNFDPNEPMVKISFQMKIEQLVDSYIMQLAPISFVKELVTSLMGGGAEEAAAATAEKEMKEPVLQPQGIPKPQPQPQMHSQQPIQQPQIGAQYQNQQQSQQQFPGGPGYQQQPSFQQPNPEPVNVEKVVFPEFSHTEDTNAVPGNIKLIEDVPLQVTVQLGKTQMAIKDILELGSGSIIELDKLAGEPVDLLVNGKLIAKGEVVVIDENFGFRVKDIVSPLERIKQV